jgi:ribosome-binding protein aMBF1 (putative translation factor)
MSEIIGKESADERQSGDRVGAGVLPTCFVCGKKSEWGRIEAPPIDVWGTEAFVCSECFKAGPTAASERLRESAHESRKRAHDLRERALRLEEFADDLRRVSSW